MCATRRVLYALAVGLLLAGPVQAQVTTADLVGRITDASGGVLPGATVTLTNEGTRDVRVATTGESGDYVFNLLPIGSYTVAVTLQGFGSQSTKVTLSAGDRVRFDSKLQVGVLAETITVAAASPLLQTDTSTLSSLVTEKAVQDLPVNGRNFVRLVQLAPGAHEGLPNSLASGTRPDDRRQTSAISINGALDNQNNQLIDGMDNNERAIGTIGVKPSIDAIAQVKVQTSNYTAETGRTAGGVVNILTKSGTNNFRGTAFEFARNDRFDAKNFFAATKPELSQHQFGGSLGGPLKTDRTFFFADYEGFRQTQGVTNVITVPTARMRSGDFGELSVAIHDPLAGRAPFANNQIPANRLDPIALKYMALYPAPTSPGLANNYASITQRTQDSSTADVRVDHRFSDSTSMFARYSYNNVDTFTPSACPPTAEGIEPGCGGGLAFPGPNITKAHGVQGNFVRVHSDSLISEFKVGYLKADIQSLPLNYGTNLSQQFGIPGVNVDDVTSGLALMTLTGFSALGDSTFIPLIQIDDTWQFNGSITKTFGAHNIKVGAAYIARQFVVFQSASPVGNFTFNPQLTDNGAGVGGNTIASFLLGFPSQVARSHSLIYPHYQTNEPSVFVQDDWRATDWLTLNLGVRYDVFTPYSERDGQISNFDVANARILLADVDGVSKHAGVATDYSNIAPRLGFSATLPGSMVIRGGYGLAYFPGNYMSQSFMKNQPFVSAYGPVLSGGTTGGGAPTLRLSDGLPLPVAPSYTNPSGSIIGVAQDFKSTRVTQFNLTVEKEFAGNVVAAGYVGSRGDNVAFVVGDINLAPIGAGAVQARRPYNSRLPGISSIGMFESDFESFYNALQLVFQRRHNNGLSFSTNYTLAHNEWTQPLPWDVSQVERFDADNDVRHRVTASVNYELPFGRDLTGLAQQVLGGWQVNAVATWQTGLPFNITNATARVNTGGGDRPNLVGEAELDDPDHTRWFNTAAFAAQPINTIGDAVVARNFLHGPSQRRLDLSLFKDFALPRNARLQFRVEAYNVTNAVNFANPNGALGNAAFGTITATNGTPRQMQFALKLLF
jgi:outer membrane receptor protein involved in Fe transport